MQVPARSLDKTLAALADPTRRAIVAKLARGEASVGELAEPFAMSQPAVSKHLKVLEAAGLVQRGRDRQRRPCRLAPNALQEVEGWLRETRRLWERRFERLDGVLGELQSQHGSMEKEDGHE